MLKNIREKLIDELNYFSEELKETKKQYEKLENEYKTGQELIRATNYQKSATVALFGGILPASVTLLIGGGIILAFWEIIGKFLLAGEVLFALYFGKTIIKNTKKYKLANRRLEVAQNNASSSLFDLNDELDIFEADLDIRVRYHMDNYLKKIQICEDSIKSLWSILNNNNLANALASSYPDTFNLSDILEDEWLAYIEEISKIPISKIHIETDEIDEDCYKESTQKLHIEPKKLENKPNHPLQAY